METAVTMSIDEAAQFIRGGGVVAFPTETVYGLGANAFDARAIEKMFKAKRRPADNPLIAHVSSIDQISELSSFLTETAKRFVDAFFPGPLTIVVAKSSSVPLIATAGLETIGIRMPRFEFAREFIKKCGVPLVAPSANLSGRPSPTTWQAVYEDLNGRIDCILQGEPTEIGLESTVVDCTGTVPVVLRKGSVSIEELRGVVQETIMNEDEGGPVRSPGLRHRHYSPSASVVVATETSIDDAESSAYIGLEKPAGDFVLVRICDSVEEYARSVFAFFRECDALGIKKIYCQAVDETGIGSALMDRLGRAAQG